MDRASSMRRQMAGVAILAAALTACRKHEAVPTNGSSVEVDRSGGNVTIRTAGATASAGATGSLPAGFPNDVPVYPGAHVAAAVEAGGGIHAATFETNDWPDDVAKFYAGRLSGWKTAADLKTEDGHTLLLRSPDGKRSLTLAARREALNTVFTLTVSPR